MKQASRVNNWVPVLGMVAAVALSGCVATGGDRYPKPLAEGKVETPVAQEIASAVFIREPGEVQTQAVNIFVNGEYMTSLQDGAFKQQKEWVGQNTLVAHPSDVGTRYQEKRLNLPKFQVAAGEVAYFRVAAGADGKPVLQQLDAETGQQLARAQKEQMHALSRVEPKCVVPLKTYTLETSALFPFDRHDYGSMLEQGKQDIARVARDIAASDARVDRIEIVGHTDPEGSDAYNQTLSERRAATVQQALQQHQLPTRNLKAEGRGESQLVVSDCRARYPNQKAQRTQCDQPNRRVEIVLYGTTAGNIPGQ